MLRQDHLSVLESRNTGELRDRIIEFGHKVGFERVGAVTVVDRSIDGPRFVNIDNVPKAYSSLYFDDERGGSDPVAQHCKRSSLPITWSQDTYTAHGCGEQWEQQVPFGYGAGIALALHLPHGRHFLFGVSRVEPLPADAGELTRLIADVQLFAVHACEAMARLLSPQLVGDPEATPLTPRELECLRWTMEGKTAWEVGELLGITERTAVLHVNNATHKLNCASKHQAVVKAMRIGLIH